MYVLDGKKHVYNNKLWAYRDYEFVDTRNQISRPYGKKRSVIRIDPVTQEKVCYESFKVVHDSGFDRKQVSLCCQNKKPMYRNFYWKYKDSL